MFKQQNLDAILAEILHKNRSKSQDGQVASYIPELSKREPNKAAIAFWDKDGLTLAGDYEQEFTLQSISKIITLMVALRDRGIDEVFARVGAEPTGDSFNSIIKLETATDYRPLNPMINAGAIAVCSLLEGTSVEERFSKVTDLLSKILDRPVTIDKNVYESERDTGHRNRSLAYFLKDTGVLQGDVEEVVDLYFRQCSILVNCADLARIGMFLAMKGINFAGESLISPHIVRITTTFMVTCGMYNASGEFAIQVGIPAKSGVSGGILATVPGRCGVGTFGPSLDEKGNSIVGVMMMRDLASQLDLSIF